MIARTLLALCLAGVIQADELEKDFATPPASAQPWVYWFFMDGNLTREGMTADLEAMKRAGIGGVIMMEVDVGIPRGPVKFMSGPWRELFKHAVLEAQRLGLQITLNAGPGWTGSGGPWVKPEQSMQHLVASETTVTGPKHFDAALPRPQPRKPFFGEQTLTPELKKQWQEFYQDVVVLAFPTPKGNQRIADIDEKALYYRAPYSSQPGVKPCLPAPAEFATLPPEQCIARSRVIDLTAKLAADGRLAWDVPEGDWTILRFGRTITGQVTRPAPEPGLGFECDKFDPAALDAHFEDFVGTLLKTVGTPQQSGAGWTSLHIDSWEMSSQNWSGKFREQFVQRRGYDPLLYLPVMTGRVVDNLAVSERFLWDLRQTAQELVIENHAQHLKDLGRKHGFGLSIEPYDLNPCADLALGGVADVPMCEFWSRGYGFNTDFSCFEAVSIAHTQGKNITAAESFTSSGDGWHQYPAAMKAQGDWALCCGINRFVFHRYQHQPWLDRYPGMTFASIGVHWERTETWWDMASAYHTYLARCQTMLRRGLPVADILYLLPEGAPNVFTPPKSATDQATGLPDRRGFNFDACAPGTLLERVAVKDGRIAFPDGMSYRILVLPRFQTMTPALLRKISSLVADGATVVGMPPKTSPGLTDFPQCDEQVKTLAAQTWDSARERHAIFDEEAASDGTPAGLLRDAKWIWHDEGQPATDAPAGKRFFQTSISLPAGKPIASAQAVMSADNSFELWINGRQAGRGDNFHQVASMDIATLLQPGPNDVTVVAENADNNGQPNPAGLIGTLAVRFRDGIETVVHTDGRWVSALTRTGTFKPVRELGSASMPPWNLLEGLPAPELYPNYDVTTKLLRKLGAKPDFEADGSVRYIHRRDGATDIYFVANRTNHPLTTVGCFRVTGRQPEWWNPLTGERRVLPQFAQHDGITEVPLELARFGSGFVVFRGKAALAAGRNFAESKTVTQIPGPWEVSFDPKWGGPAQATFYKLDDWMERPEPGIRNYSGKATYRTKFDGNAGRFLSLGNVAVMAQVKLNGRDLGIVWCDPWRVEIPDGLLRAHGNELEITVANLWINRLIADAGLPAEKRLTSTTWSPYQPNSPLQSSGLLGPVQIAE